MFKSRQFLARQFNARQFGGDGPAPPVIIIPAGGGWQLVANMQAQWLRREDEELIIIYGRHAK